MDLDKIQKLVTSAEVVMSGFTIWRDRETGKPTVWREPNNCREQSLTELHTIIKEVKKDLQYEQLMVGGA